MQQEANKAQQDAQSRQVFLETYDQLYSNIVNFLNRLDLHPVLKSHCFQNLDQGSYWARQAISQLQFNFSQASEVKDVAPDEVVLDKVESPAENVENQTIN